jgi:hypothetical protein
MPYIFLHRTLDTIYELGYSTILEFGYEYHFFIHTNENKYILEELIYHLKDKYKNIISDKKCEFYNVDIKKMSHSIIAYLSDPNYNIKKIIEYLQVNLSKHMKLELIQDDTYYLLKNDEISLFVLEHDLYWDIICDNIKIIHITPSQLYKSFKSKL